MTHTEKQYVSLLENIIIGQFLNTKKEYDIIKVGPGDLHYTCAQLKDMIKKNRKDRSPPSNFSDQRDSRCDWYDR